MLLLRSHNGHRLRPLVSGTSWHCARRRDFGSGSTTADKIPLTSTVLSQGVPVGADGARDWSRPLQPPAAQRFVGKNAVVTGSRMGVGFVIARTLAAEGANVCLVDLRDASDAVGVISADGDGGPGSITQVQCDITDEAQVVAMAAEVSEIFGGECDVLINNAGYNGKCQLVRDMKLEDWEFTMKINLTGTMLVTRELIPLLESGGGGGKICNLASNVARRGLPYRADYVCSKWAIIGLTQTLAHELVDAGVRVNCVCPGPIEGERIEQVMDMHMQAEGHSECKPSTKLS